MHTLSPLYNMSYTGVPLARTPHSTICSCNCRFSILLNIFTLYSITLLHAHFTTHIITLFSITFLHAYLTTVNHSFPSLYYTYILLQINHSFAIFTTRTVQVCPSHGQLVQQRGDALIGGPRSPVDVGPRQHETHTS